jgi:hypothetical protein
MSEIKLERWIYLDDDYAEEGRRDLLVFFTEDLYVPPFDPGRSLSFLQGALSNAYPVN